MRKGYKKIEVYFPDAEYEAFLKKVKRTNLSISAFVRKMAAEQVIREAPHADVPRLWIEVKRVETASISFSSLLTQRDSLIRQR